MHIRLTIIRKVPSNTDFNFGRLFFSNQSATNSRDSPGNRQSSLCGSASTEK